MTSLIRSNTWLAALLAFLATWVSPAVSAAQAPQGSGQMGGGDDGMMAGGCPMCGMDGPWMTVSMLLGVVLVLTTIAALVALTVFLLRRSRTPAPG